MVDTSKRRRAASLIQQFVDGKISNDDYDSDFPDDTADQGLLAVYDRLWLLYSDLASSRFDKSKLTDEGMSVIARCIAFLETDLEYEGPQLRERKPFGGLKSLLGRLVSPKPESALGADAQRESIFHSGWWPFASEAQYASVRGR